jgi:hypothetical protein
MKTSYLVAIVAFSLCSGSVGAESVVVGHSSGRVADAITLHNASPSSIMWGLRLFDFNDLKCGNTSVWRRDKEALSSEGCGSVVMRANSPVVSTIDPASPAPSGAVSGSAASPRSTSSSVDLPGIDLVVPCDRERVLVVYGEKAAVKELKTRVLSMDVVQKSVQIQAEVMSAAADEKELGLNLGNQAAAGLNQSQLAALRKSLLESGAEVVGSPILAIANNEPGHISVSSSDLDSFQVYALPKINTDGTVTVQIQVSLTKPIPGQDQTSTRTNELYSQRRLADGETVLLGGWSRHGSDTARTLLVLLTAKVMD